MEGPSAEEIAACIRGDQRAWTRLVGVCTPAARGAIRTVLRSTGRPMDPEEMEDLVQETLLCLLEDDGHRLKLFNPEKSCFSSWVALIARQRALEVERHRPAVTLPLEAASEIPTPTPSPQADDFEVPDGILSPREKSVIELAYRRDRSLDEIRKELGLSLQTVKNHKATGIRKLREFFRSKKLPRTPGD